MLILNANRESYMGNPTVPLNVTVSDIESSLSRSLTFYAVECSTL